MELDPSDHGSDALHRVVTTLVSPRPIGWISTVDADGRDNLAPYSYFNAVSADPPVVLFSAGTRDGERKDTPRNALETGEFVVNLVTEPLAAAMNETSAATEGSEFDAAGLERAPASRVAAADAALECEVLDHFAVYDNTVVLGEVTRVHVDDGLTTDGTVDAERVDTVGRLGGPYYTRLDRLDLERSHFGRWDGPAPPGFVVDEATAELRVDREAFLSVRDALRRLEDGADVAAVVADTDLDREALAAASERRGWYLDGSVGDERVEAALAAADLPASFTH
jgi:flavin reductase (DIM6/NTAB) family NADH-FMN oxidoreductase RutF